MRAPLPPQPSSETGTSSEPPSYASLAQDLTDYEQLLSRTSESDRRRAAYQGERIRVTRSREQELISRQVAADAEAVMQDNFRESRREVDIRSDRCSSRAVRRSAEDIEQRAEDIRHANAMGSELNRRMAAERQEALLSQNAHFAESMTRLSVEQDIGIQGSLHEGAQYPHPNSNEVTKDAILQLIRHRCRRYDKMRDFLTKSDGMTGVLDLSVIYLATQKLDWTPEIGVRVHKITPSIHQLLLDKKLGGVTSYQAKNCIHYALFSTDGKECMAYMCLLVSRLASYESQVAFRHISIQLLAASKEGVAKAWIESLKAFAVETGSVLSTQVSNNAVAKDFWAGRFFRSRSYMKYTLILAHASQCRLPIYVDVDADYGFDM